MAFEELKERQGAMWGSAPYERVAGTTADIHELVVEMLEPRPGLRRLDLACGSGAVAGRAAALGAEVTRVDLPSSPFDWGDERHVMALLGEWFELTFAPGVSIFRAPSGDSYRQLNSTSYGPTKTPADSVGERR